MRTKTHDILQRLCWGVLLAYLCPGAEAGLFEFRYAGNLFTNATSPLDTGDAVTARFVLDLPSPASLPRGSYLQDLVNGRVLVSDGARVLTNSSSNPQAFSTIVLETGPDGVPTDWKVSIDTIDASDAIFTESYDCVFPSLGPACDFSSTDNEPLAWVSNDSGQWTVQQVISGDFNRDGYVDAIDYANWRESYGRTGALLQSDGTLDGVVDEADFNLWLNNYGSSLSPAPLLAAPSPAGLECLLALLAALCSTRRGFAASRLRMPKR